MLKQKTVFVIGAGSSYELNLPLGSGLKDMILDATAPHHGQGSELQRAFREGVEAYVQTTDIYPTAQAAYYDTDAAISRLRSGLPGWPSIDNFLHARQSDQLLVIMGKLAIATCISYAEHQSYLFAGNAGAAGQVPLNSPNLKESWFPRLTDLLFAGHRVESVGEVFANVVFVIFNYDRCIEHYLFNALSFAFGLSHNDTAAIMRRMQFIHPYGTIGPLPWQDGSRDFLEHGFLREFGSLHETYAASRSIKTFTESRASQEDKFMHLLMAEAHTAIYMGFGFIEQNVILLTNPVNQLRRAFITSAGLSDPDTDIAVKMMERMFGQTTYGYRGVERGGFQILVERGTCSELMRDHMLRLQT